jgi:hypothetical protein
MESPELGRDYTNRCRSRLHEEEAESAAGQKVSRPSILGRYSNEASQTGEIHTAGQISSFVPFLEHLHQCSVCAFLPLRDTTPSHRPLIRH